MADEPEVRADDVKVNGAASPLVVKLRKSIIANGDEVNELKFREPTAGDIERCGNPVIIDMLSGDTPKMTFEAKSMTQMMAMLAAVPPSTIRQMHPRDWNNAAWTLASFFMPEL
jgi:hypothetical protein